MPLSTTEINDIARSAQVALDSIRDVSSAAAQIGNPADWVIDFAADAETQIASIMNRLRSEARSTEVADTSL